MKLSIVLSIQPASFSALAYKGKVIENIRKIKDLGYEGVELAIRDPDLLDLSELQSVLAETELPVSAIGTGQAFTEEGLSFTSKRREIREKSVERIRSQIRLADVLHAIVIIGLIRGRQESGIDKAQSEAWLTDAVRICADENESIKLAIEPVNRYESDLINTVSEGLQLIEKIDRKNVGLLLDTFHMNIEERSILESINNARDHIFHFHIADSNRWYPGAGHLDFGKIMTKLSQISYEGFVSAEILPLPDPDSSAVATIKNIQVLVPELK